MSNIKIKQVMLGSGMPKICVPLVSKTIDDLQNEIQNLSTTSYDLVEWRCDYFCDLSNIDLVVKTCLMLKTQLKDTPLIFTCRTKSEGGQANISNLDYFLLNESIINHQAADIIDIELLMGDDHILKMLALAKDKQMSVMLSNHDMLKTPPLDEMLHRMCKMQQLGADICKLAIMPKTKSDVLSLLQASVIMKKQQTSCPIVTIALGELGVISRLVGSFSGSCMTFGIASNASAPGQIPSNQLAAILELLDHV